MSRAIRRTVVIGLLTAAAFIVLSGVHLRWTPAPAIFDSIALAGSPDGAVFESDVIVVDATLAGLSWTGRAPEAVWVRSSVDGVDWSQWVQLGLQPDHAPDPGTGEARDTKPATDPAYFGPVSFLQFRVQDASQGITASAADRFRAEVVETSGRGLDMRQKIVRFVSSIEFGRGSEAEGTPGTPTIIPNEAWGGPQCIAGVQPRKLPVVHRAEFVIVHHAGNNDYAEGQGALDLIYAFCSYHVSSRGWWDIAYNFLVDRYGNIYEGRRGSIEAQIRGGHTAGFNEYTLGVALMGNFEEAHPDGGIPTQESMDALEELLAWRMDTHHIPASGVVTVESLDGSTNAKWADGTFVEFDRIAGHLDARKTACPGSFSYSLLGGVRTNVATAGEPKFTADFSNFDPLIFGTPGDLILDAPSDAAWTVSAIRRFGSTVWSVSGTGPDTVTWDAQVAPGPYTIRIEFGSLGVHEQLVRVGDYEWPFVDDEGSYARVEINEMWNRGVTVGCDWNRFCPSGTLTRAEIATFVARAMDGEHHYPAYQGDYSDVMEGRWYTGAIEYLVAEGLLPGGGGVYGVQDSATRTMVVELVMGVVGDTAYPGYQEYFKDVAEGMWYTPMIERAHELGIALGYPDGTFRPDDFLTREEAAAFLMRGLD